MDDGLLCYDLLVHKWIAANLENLLQCNGNHNADTLLNSHQLFSISLKHFPFTLISLYLWATYFPVGSTTYSIIGPSPIGLALALLSWSASRCRFGLKISPPHHNTVLYYHSSMCELVGVMASVIQHGHMGACKPHIMNTLTQASSTLHRIPTFCYQNNKPPIISLWMFCISIHFIPLICGWVMDATGLEGKPESYAL